MDQDAGDDALGDVDDDDCDVVDIVFVGGSVIINVDVVFDHHQLHD